MDESYMLIIYRVEDRIARITLNRPEKRNALSTTLRRRDRRRAQAAERDDEVSVVLIEGAGPSFCSGYDITPPAGTRPAGRVRLARSCSTAGPTSSPAAACATG